jgi:hypothetical protein
MEGLMNKRLIVTLLVVALLALVATVAFTQPQKEARYSITTWETVTEGGAPVTCYILLADNGAQSISCLEVE